MKRIPILRAEVYRQNRKTRNSLPDGYIEGKDFFVRIRGDKFQRLKNYSITGIIQEKEKQINKLNRQLKNISDDDFDRYDEILSKIDSLRTEIKYLNVKSQERGTGSTSTSNT